MHFSRFILKESMLWVNIQLFSLWEHSFVKNKQIPALERLLFCKDIQTELVLSV